MTSSSDRTADRRADARDADSEPDINVELGTRTEDVPLTTDDDAQRVDLPVRPDNS